MVPLKIQRGGVACAVPSGGGADAGRRRCFCASARQRGQVAPPTTSPLRIDHTLLKADATSAVMFSVLR